MAVLEGLLELMDLAEAHWTDRQGQARFVRARSVGLNSTLDASPRRTSPTFWAMAPYRAATPSPSLS